jgi:hypothetical protein
MVISAVAVEGASENLMRGRGTNHMYDMPWGSTSPGTFTFVAMAVTLLGIVTGLAALVIASRLFNRFGGRAS